MSQSKELDTLIQNWRRWCFGNDGLPTWHNRAQSLEGNHIAPWPENDRPNTNPVDELSALKIQLAIVKLPDNLRLIFLVEHFPRRAKEGGYFWPAKHSLHRYAKCQSWNYPILVQKSRNDLLAILRK